MSIFGRIGSIFKSNVNSALDSMEDPSKMIDQTLRDLNKDLQDVTTQTAKIMAEKRTLEGEVHEMEASIEKLIDYAQKAVDAGNDEDAKRFLSQKNKIVTQLNSKKSLLETVSKDVDRLRTVQSDLRIKVQELESRKDGIKLKATHAKAQEKINKLTSNVAGTDISKFDDYERKIDRQLHTAQAMQELSNDPDNVSSLMNKYDSNGSVDDELAMLKAKKGN